MPADVLLDVPIPGKLPPDFTIAEARSLRWCLDYGLLRNQAEARYFASMQPGALAAYCYPDSRGSDLDLAVDVMCFFGIVDDAAHFSPTGSKERAEAAREMGHDVATLVRQDRPVAPATPWGRAWCDLWARMGDGMSPAWRDRVRRDMDVLVRALLVPGTRLTTENYFAERWRSYGSPLWFALIERVGHFEVPDAVLTAPLMRDILDAAGRASILLHDMVSLEREEARGETTNFVLLVERETGESRPTVLSRVQGMVHDAWQRFLSLERQVPDLTARLPLAPADRILVSAYVQAVRDWLCGQHAWHARGSARYSPEAALDAVSCGYEEAPPTQPAPASRSAPAVQPPRHLALIPDGNRRWARANGLTPQDGFRHGAAHSADVLAWCAEAGIAVVSLWLSSPDNLAKRSSAQVAVALQHTADFIRGLATARRFRLRPMGDLSLLPGEFAALLRQAAQDTAAVDGMTVNLAAAYDGRSDLLDAVHACLHEEPDIPVTPQRIDGRLATRGQPPVDLLIRTSGEQRLSGFMPWQTTDTELYFTDTPWPAFTRNDLRQALADYGNREQRHGA